MARTGRRPGNADTRASIVAAARAAFAAKGFAGATIRGIAAEAGVDPALVHHYFGTKRDLFIETVQLPFDPVTIMEGVAEADPDHAGEELLRQMLAAINTPRGEAMVQSLLRSALTNDEILAMVREFMVTTVLTRLTRRISPDRHDLRTALVASQITGVALVRHILRIDPLPSLDDEVIVAAVGPTLQRYLTGDFPAP